MSLITQTYTFSHLYTKIAVKYSFINTSIMTVHCCDKHNTLLLLHIFPINESNSHINKYYIAF